MTVELQLPRVAALAFGSLPNIGSFFPQPALVPDFYPTFPLAMTNAILLDVDGDGWQRPGDGPAFCSAACDPTDAEGLCPDDQVCLETELVCGYDIPGECTTAAPGTGFTAARLVE